MDEIVEEFINEFEKSYGASRDEPVMGKKKDVRLTGGKKEYEFEGIFDRIKKELL